MKRIQKMIPTAIDVADRELKIKSGSEKDKIAGEFNGYISSFGASIISAGLLPSVIFFSQKGESASERHKIILCIQEILKKHGRPALNLIKEVKELYSINDGNRETINLLTSDIFDAAVALKLAIRTFPKSKKD